MFSFIKSKLQKIFSTVTSKLGLFFSKSTIDAAALKELEILLISSDVGVGTTKSIIAELKKHVDQGLVDGAHLKRYMHSHLLTILTKNTLLRQGYEGQAADYRQQNIFLFVGINGSGKTTSIGKLHIVSSKGKKFFLLQLIHSVQQHQSNC